MQKHIFSLTLALLFTFVIVFTIFILLLNSKVRLTENSVVYDYQAGVPLNTLLSDLKEKGVIRYTWVLKAYARVWGNDKKLKAGEYYFGEGMSHREVIQKIARGEVLLHPFQIIEGWSIHQLMDELSKLDNIERRIDFKTKTWLTQITQEYKHPEGLFMPETYHYPKGETDLAILTRAHQDLTCYLKKAWELRSSLTRYDNPYQALIVASIVEKETSIPSERRQIAGVLIRRLNSNMKLQMDPTVIYGMGENYNGNITKDDLRRDTPYNTYVHYGLPPTPIALPSRESIDAALNPDEGTSLYFVAKGDGSHQFSDTLEEHNAAVAKYILGSP